jgi:hypothetical protein
MSKSLCIHFPTSEIFGLNVPENRTKNNFNVLTNKIVLTRIPIFKLLHLMFEGFIISRKIIGLTRNEVRRTGTLE